MRHDDAHSGQADSAVIWSSSSRQPPRARPFGLSHTIDDTDPSYCRHSLRCRAV